MRVVVGIKRVGVCEIVAVAGISSVWVNVKDAVKVGVGIYSATDSIVNATIVFRLEIAELTIFCGSMSAGSTLGVRGSVRAAADTMQNRLNPTTPVVITVKGPTYALILTYHLSF